MLIGLGVSGIVLADVMLFFNKLYNACRRVARWHFGFYIVLVLDALLEDG